MKYIGLVAIIVIIVGFFAYSIIAKKKRKDSTWTGVVIDKDILESIHNQNGTNQNSGGLISFNFGNRSGNRSSVVHSYTIKVKTDAGEEFNWPVSNGFYEQVNIGDQLSKPAGTELPNIVQRAQQPIPAAVQPVNTLNQPVDNQTPPNSTPPFIS